MRQVAPRRIVFLFGIALLLPVRGAMTQTVGPTTGAITGAVTDSTGAALPRVTITASSDALIGNNGTRTAVTNGEGLYRFAALPPGDYKLVFTLQGFKTLDREIHIGLGFSATVNLEMVIEGLNQLVTVERASPVIDRQSTAIGTRFDARQLSNLPNSRSTLAILAATPAVHVARIEVGGSSGDAASPFSAYGTIGGNRPMVEGIHVTGLFPTGFTLNYGSFEEVSVGTAVHGAEWQAAGVQMQFISKSGGNQNHGSLYADYENKAWQSFNVDADQINRGAQGGGGLEARDVNRLWGYHDINPDAGGYIKRDTLWWYASFREQDVAARFVNFPVKPHRTHLTNFSGKGTYQITAKNKIVAFGQAGRNYQPNRLDPFGPAGGSLTATTAINESTSTTTEQVAWGWVWKGEWNSVISDEVFFEVRAGQFGASRHQKPNGEAVRFEDVGNLVVRGGNRDWQRSLQRDQVLASISYFKDDWLGNHHLKLGSEILRTTETEIWTKGYPGDVLHVLRNELPIEVYLFETPSMSESGLSNRSAYVTDSWRLNSRLTLNLGLRIDRFRTFLPEQEHPAGSFNPTLQSFAAVDNLIDWNVIAPRLGAIYDLVGNGKTIAKFSYGRYWDAPGTQLGFNANPNAEQWWRRYGWNDPDNSGTWEPGEEGALLGSRGGDALESVDPGLNLPYLIEIAASVERELPADIAVRTGLVWRGERQHDIRQNANQPFEAFTVPVAIPDPGPDGQTGNADDGPGIPGYNLKPEFVDLSPVNIVRAVPHANSDYWTWDITASRRFSRRWSLVSGFTHTWSHDQASGYFGQNVRQNTYPLTPNDLINASADGRYEFRVWSAKIHGTYEGPWQVAVTPLLRHQSGQPFGRTFSTTLNYSRNVRILAEPMGTRRMDNITILDVRAQKGFRLAGGRRVAAFVDVFNLLNTNAEQNTNWSSGPSFLRPLTIVPPRIARIGATLEW